MRIIFLCCLVMASGVVSFGLMMWSAVLGMVWSVVLGMGGNEGGVR